MFDNKLEKQLEKAAPKITAAAPSKAYEAWRFFKALFFPLLPGLIKVAVEKSTSKKDENILREIRDVLVSAELGETE
jgi:hypothetical protein